MNSNFKKSSTTNPDFDFGLSHNRPRSLNASQPYAHPSSSNKPSWTHHTTPSTIGLSSGFTSMVGDISGKSWSSSVPVSSIGIINKNPNLFGDLLGSTLAQNKPNSNVPLKNSVAPSSKPSPSIPNLAHSFPNTGNHTKGNGGLGIFVSPNNTNGKKNIGSINNSSNVNKRTILDDPFVSLVDFGLKQSDGNKAYTAVDDRFGDFQNASKISTNTNNLTGTSNPGSIFDGFAIPTNEHPIPKMGVDPIDELFNSLPATHLPINQQFSEDFDWGFGDKDLGFEGNDSSGTTELEGLPPRGISACSAASKGLDNQKSGQYADAIKWLSWAVILHEKAGEHDSTMVTLSRRASCYKEVGEYKKAVADCTKVLERDSKNVAVLVQRALLYESMEKYKLGAEDLRTVMKLDPGNRVARTTVHRLIKMSE